jgi:hypothetical protein
MGETFEEVCLQVWYAYQNRWEKGEKSARRLV